MKEIVKGLGIFGLTLAVLILIGVDPMVSAAFAGTGGAEVNDVWTWISDGLQGTWGKIFAAIFIGFAILAAKSGNAIATLVFAAIAYIIGKVPDIVGTSYTGTF
ncbi:hypothetical protein [Persephonella sp.]